MTPAAIRSGATATSEIGQTDAKNRAQLYTLITFTGDAEEREIMAYRITGLPAERFRDLYGRSDEELAARGVLRCVVDETPGYPDRIEMREADVGETVLLLNHIHQPAKNPYHSDHAIFVREGALNTYDRVDEIPEVIRHRLMSLRAFDRDDMMVDADVVDGSNVETAIERFFANPKIAYIHAHNAKRGCFSARIDRG